MKYALMFLATTLIFAKVFAQEPHGAAKSSGGVSHSVPADDQNQRKARTLLDQAIQALGGSAYLNIQDVSQEGRAYSFHLGRPTSAGVVFWRFYKYPDKDRVELTKKRDVVEIFNGNKGVEITYKGARAMDPKDVSDYLRRKEYALDWVFRKWLTEPRVALFYEGPTVADQKSAEQVTIMNSKNEGVTLYIDADTHLPIKKTFSWRDPADKQRNVEDEIYDNYRPVQGIMTPFVLTRYYNGDMSNQRFIMETSYNNGVSDTKFPVETSNLPSPVAPSK